jgi:hypothetical protein
MYRVVVPESHAIQFNSISNYYSKFGDNTEYGEIEKRGGASTYGCIISYSRKQRAPKARGNTCLPAPQMGNIRHLGYRFVAP